MAAAPTYAYAIPSLSHAIPTLPALGNLGNLDVNRSIAANTPLDSADVANAKMVVQKLEATMESPVNPGVTDAVVQAAELRLHAIQGAHVASIYAPGLMAGIAAILQRLDAIDGRINTIDGRINAATGRLGTIEGSLHTIEGRVGTIATRLDDLSGRMGVVEGSVKLNNALTQNHRIISKNSYSQPHCEPLLKTVPGDGWDLVDTLISGNERRGVVAPAQPDHIGALPPNFTHNISSYKNKDIARLIIFYNQDFGIVVGDDEAERRAKLIKFLSRY